VTDRSPGSGAAMFAHLQEVHTMFRGQLALLVEAAGQWADGAAAPDTVMAAAGPFAAAGSGRDLRVHCLYYCRSLTMHHSIEDTGMFPQLRAAAPEAAALFDRLEAEHHAVAKIIGELEDLLSTAQDSSAPALHASLTRLSDQLTAHLDYEERVLEPLFGP
jgi:Hemerythrin HHE cation binding domain